MTVWLALGAALAVAVVVVVALPFLREPAPASDALHELDPRERELLDAQETRDRALAALKELEADHRAGSHLRRGLPRGDRRRPTRRSRRAP